MYDGSNLASYDYCVLIVISSAGIKHVKNVVVLSNTKVITVLPGLKKVENHCQLKFNVCLCGRPRVLAASPRPRCGHPGLCSAAETLFNTGSIIGFRFYTNLFVTVKTQVHGLKYCLSTSLSHYIASFDK